MNKFDKYKNNLYSILPAIFFIFLFAAYMAVSMNDGAIDNFFGYPDVNIHIDNEESYLLDYFIKYQDFGEHWKIKQVRVIEDEDYSSNWPFFTYLDIEGQYQRHNFELSQDIYINSNESESIEKMNKFIENRYLNPEKFNYREIYVDNNHAVSEISTYCYNMDRIANEAPWFTSCALVQIDSNILVILEFNISAELNGQEAIQITDELKSMMQNTK
jgi:hypothetical protein